MTTRFKIQTLIIFSVLLVYQFGYSQVNTETLRKSNLSFGFHNTAQLDFSMVSGNSEFLKAKTSFRTDFVTKNYYSFGVIQYQRGIKSQMNFINKGFVHLRSSRRLPNRFNGELFIQKEFDDFILLKDRNLFGGGLRTAFFQSESLKGKFKFFLGNGAMWENEKLNTTPVSETKIIRSTNYLSCQMRMNNQVNVNFVGYYQVNLERFLDYRILVESAVGINLTKSFTFQTNFNLRFDNEPPSTIKKCDVELTNGLKFSF